MCLISTEIHEVSKTNILVSPNFNNTRQLVVYSNFVDNISDSNAMVLPVPYPNSVQFIDLSKYKNLFEDCADCFYNPNASRSYAVLSNSSESFNDSNDKPLKVFNVGSYQVSLAKSLQQINRVDERVFKLSSGLRNTLNKFYNEDYWGFIICKLSKGSESYHPFGYSHEIINNKIYIPTRHYHQEVKWNNFNDLSLGLPLDLERNQFSSLSWNESNIDNSPMFKYEQFGTRNTTSHYPNEFNQTNLFEPGRIGNISSKTNNLKKLNDKNYSAKSQFYPESNIQYKEIADDWSHSIYLLNTNPFLNPQIKQMNTCKEIWDTKSLFDPDKINFDFGRCNNFTKLQVEGTYPNIDLIVPISV